MAPKDLDELARLASECVACDLHRTRSSVVFGSGAAPASLMFIGEAPGHDEDLAGLPFVGRSGQLVVALLEEECGRTRDWCYIANVVKCRPPANRDPRPAEVASCRHFLERQIELVGPRLVITLGNFATRTILGTMKGITELRGTVFDRDGYSVLPTFHPAAALRSGPKVTELMRRDFRLGAALLADREPR